MLAFLAHDHKTAVAQNLQVLGNRRLSESQRVNETADAHFTVALTMFELGFQKHAKQFAPVWISNDVEYVSHSDRVSISAG
jgi:hypothetical protein